MTTLGVPVGCVCTNLSFFNFLIGYDGVTHPFIQIMIIGVDHAYVIKSVDVVNVITIHNPIEIEFRSNRHSVNYKIMFSYNLKDQEFELRR